MLYLPCPRESHLTWGFGALWLPSVVPNRTASLPRLLVGYMHCWLCVLSQRNVLVSLGMNVCSLSDLQCVTSNLCIEDSCLVLWVQFPFKVILKKTKTPPHEFEGMIWKIVPYCCKINIKVSVLKAYFTLQIPLFVPQWRLQHFSFLITVFHRTNNYVLFSFLLLPKMLQVSQQYLVTRNIFNASTGVLDKFHYFIRVKGWSLPLGICVWAPKEERCVWKRT